MSKENYLFGMPVQISGTVSNSAEMPTPDPAVMRDYIDRLTRFWMDNPEWHRLCEEARGYIGALNPAQPHGFRPFPPERRP